VKSKNAIPYTEEEWFFYERYPEFVNTKWLKQIGYVIPTTHP